jgi:SAM-dependent methyltransferase
MMRKFVSGNLRGQYERFPYPPVSALALPVRGQGLPLRYENARLFLNRKLSSDGIQILVIGGGTLEPLVVAFAHPNAREVVTIDLSRHSTEILNRRILFSKIVRPFSKRAPIRALLGNYLESGTQLGGPFDYIIASNVFHHTPDPAHSLFEAAKLLKIGGVLRMVTYPASSRIWMRAASRYLKREGVDRVPHLKAAALSAVRKLPITDPIRATFESHPERNTEAGIIDAFFNACENPLPPLSWKDAAEAAGLNLIAETQDKDSHSRLVSEFLGTRANILNVWEKLQILDDTWELCANPILWFEKTAEGTRAPFVRTSVTQETLASPSEKEIPEKEIKEQFRRADHLLQNAGSSLLEWHAWLTREVGPRVWPDHPDELLRGLSITEFSPEKIASFLKN